MQALVQYVVKPITLNLYPATYPALGSLNTEFQGHTTCLNSNKCQVM